MIAGQLGLVDAGRLMTETVFVQDDEDPSDLPIPSHPEVPRAKAPAPATIVSTDDELSEALSLSTVASVSAPFFKALEYVRNFARVGRFSAPSIETLIQHNTYHTHFASLIVALYNKAQTTTMRGGYRSHDSAVLNVQDFRIEMEWFKIDHSREI